MDMLRGEKTFDICTACSVQGTGCIEFVCQWLDGKWAPASCGLFSSQAVTLYALASSGINCNTTISLSSSCCLCRVIEALMGVIYAYISAPNLHQYMQPLSSFSGWYWCASLLSDCDRWGGVGWGVITACTRISQQVSATDVPSVHPTITSPFSAHTPPQQVLSLLAPRHHKSFLCVHLTITSSFSARIPPSQVLSLHTPCHHKSFLCMHPTITSPLPLWTPPSQVLSLHAPHHHKFFLCTHPTITSPFSAHTPTSQVLSLLAPHHHKSFAKPRKKVMVWYFRN